MLANPRPCQQLSVFGGAKLQTDLDERIDHYNTERTHQGKMCCGRTPFETMIKGNQIWKEEFVN